MSGGEARMLTLSVASGSRGRKALESTATDRRAAAQQQRDSSLAACVCACLPQTLSGIRRGVLPDHHLAGDPVDPDLTRRRAHLLAGGSEGALVDIGFRLTTDLDVAIRPPDHVRRLQPSEAQCDPKARNPQSHPDCQTGRAYHDKSDPAFSGF